MDILFSRCQCNLCFYKWFGLFSLPFIHPITFISLLQTVINVTTNQNTLKDLHFCLHHSCSFCHNKKASNFFSRRHFFFGVSQECYKCKSARWAIKSRSGNLHELINSRREVESFFFWCFSCAKKWFNHCFP